MLNKVRPLPSSTLANCLHESGRPIRICLSSQWQSTCDKALHALAEQLPAHFLLVHRSYIINTQQIKQITKDLRQVRLTFE
ncbi:MAG: LytTR family transcriptional regulator [Saprospiraceae bacterium]|nr:LytTR family transcriptional regulator [Saprospiraceae bacterium]